MVEVPMVVRRPPMMQAKLNGMRNVEGENPLGKGTEEKSSGECACRITGGIIGLRAVGCKISACSVNSEGHV